MSLASSSTLSTTAPPSGLTVGSIEDTFGAVVAISDRHHYVVVGIGEVVPAFLERAGLISVAVTHDDVIDVPQAVDEQAHVCSSHFTFDAYLRAFSCYSVLFGSTPRYLFPMWPALVNTQRK